jgi:hypothetical protein
MLGVLLTLAMILSLLPFGSLTAFAAPASDSTLAAEAEPVLRDGRVYLPLSAAQAALPDIRFEVKLDGGVGIVMASLETRTLQMSVPEQAFFQGELLYVPVTNVINVLGGASVVTFDYNGGTGAVEKKNVLVGAPYGELPAATHGQGYVFLGWSTDGT